MTQGPIPDVDTKLREQAILNRVYDESTNTLKTSTSSGSTPATDSTLSTLSDKFLSDKSEIKITEANSYTYVAYAPPGTAESAAAWMVKRIDETVAGTTKILYADGNANFDNVATDLTALTYS